MDKPRVVIAVPLYASVPAELMIKFGHLCIQTSQDVDLAGVVDVSCSLVNWARNTLVNEARRVSPDATHLMFIDPDSVPDPGTITRLLSFNKRVIGATVYLKKPPYIPVIWDWVPIDENRQTWKYRDYDFPTPDSEPFVVDGIGMACTLIEMSVFSEMEAYFKDPIWFQTPSQTNRCNGKSESFTVGEDVFFCQRLNEMGIEIWCDPIDQVDHIGIFAACGPLFRNWRAKRIKAG